MATNNTILPAKTKKDEATTHTEKRRNLSKKYSEKIVALNFRVPAEFKKDFKIASAIRGVTQSELMKQVFKEWKKRHQ